MNAEEAQERARVLVSLDALTALKWAHYDESYHAHELELSLHCSRKPEGEWVASASYGDYRDGNYLRGEDKGATPEMAVVRAIVNAKDMLNNATTRINELLESTTGDDQ